jgi:hypothetical protein
VLLGVHRFGRAANDPAGLGWRVLMTFFGPLFNGSSLMTVEICSRRSTKDRIRSDGMCATAARGSAYLRSPVEMLTIFGGSRFSVVAATARDIYEPTLCYLGVAAGFVKRTATFSYGRPDLTFGSPASDRSHPRCAYLTPACHRSGRRGEPPEFPPLQFRLT